MSTDTKTRRSNIKKTVLIIGKTRKIHSASSIFSQAARYFFEPPKPKRSGEKIHNFDSSSWLCRIWNAAVSQKSGYVNISEFIRILTSFNYWMSSLRWSRFFYSFFSRRVSFFFHFTFKKILFFLTQNGNEIIPIMPFGWLSVWIWCVRAFFRRHTANECHFVWFISAFNFIGMCFFLVEI